MPRAAAAFSSTRSTVFRLEYERTRDREPRLLPPGEGARPPAGEGLQLEWKGAA